MGSDSDLKVMKHVGRALTTLGLEQGKDYEERIISAHRTPKRMMEYAADTLNRALGSMIGMPKGKPLATFQGESGAFNAGLFAVRILMLTDLDLREQYNDYESSTKDKVIENDSKLSEIGSENYL